jgi:glycosyltransferase involved in cell wall biosynthesis
MRLLFIGPNLTAGGAERQWSLLIPGLRRRGHDARLLALDAGGRFEPTFAESGVPFEVLHMRHQAHLAPLLRSPIVRGFAPELIVTRGVSGIWVGNALAALRRARHVYAEHLQVGFVLKPRRERMLRLAGSRVDRVVVVTPDQADLWIRRGYPRERVAVVPNGVAVPEALDRAAVRRELGLRDAAVVAIHVASMRPEKRLPDFVSAVREARRSTPQLEAVVVGDGVDRPAVEAAAGGDPAIRLLGERADVGRLLAAADMFVLASEFEALPMAILEAMAAGLPVIATAVGSVPDVVQEGVTGILVPPRDPQQLAQALAALTGDPSRRRTMGEAGAAAHREHWDAETMIGRYERLFGELLA